MDGPLTTQETLHHSIIFKSPLLTLHGVYEADDRFYIHSKITNPKKPSTIKYCKQVLSVLEDNLRARGFKKYYTMADSKINYKYNQIYGFTSNFEVYGDIYEVMVKDIS